MNRSKRILVVDDEARDRSLLEAILESLGHQSVLATGGHEALEKLDSTIDLVLLDVLMPGMGGFEVARQIRNCADCEGIPIVMLTALTGKEEQLKAITAGANDLITKPIDRTELQVRLASLLKMKDAQDALRRSEEKYRTLVETAQDLVWTVDLDLRYTYVSPSFTKVLGYTVDEIMSMRPLDGLTPASRERIVRTYQEALALEAARPRDRYASRTEEIERYHKDGSTRWAEITMSFLRDGSGKPVGIMGVSHDITERKQMEEALRKARDELEQRVEERTTELLRANQQLAQEITDRKKAEEAARESEERYRALFDGAAEGILVADVETTRLSSANPAICNMLGYTMEEILQLNVSDIHPAASIQHVLAEFEALVREEKALVPKVPCLRKDRSVFYADIVGSPVVIEKRRMNVGFFTNITERKKMEDSLRTSEERFRSLIDQAADAIFVHDFDGRFLEINRQACTSLGYTRDELLSMSVDDVDPDALPRGDSAKFWPNLPATFEAKHKRQDGAIFPVEIRLGAIEYGETKVMLAMARDLTDRKKAEEALRESEDRYRQITENSLTGIFIHQDGVGVYVNQRLADMLGYTKEEMIGGQFLKVVHPEDREMVAGRTLARLNDELTRAAYELRLLRKTGETIWCEVLATRVEYRGSPALMGNIADITERKKAEEELRESEERLQLALKGADLGLWDYNLQTGEAWISQRRAEMVGYSVDEIEPHISSWGRMVHPDDLHRVVEAFNAHAKGETPFYECEHRLRCKSGEYIWVLARAKVVTRDAMGSPVPLTGTSLDITERKKAEEALRESEAKYRFLAEHASDVLWTVDLDMRTTYVSPSIERVLGFAPEERMLQNVENQLTADSFDMSKKRFLEELRAEGEPGVRPDRSIVMELNFVHKNGSILCLESVMKFIRDETGNPIGCYGLSRDITERKKAETALRESEGRFRAFSEATFEAIFLSDKGVGIDQNLAAEKMFGYSVEEIRGQLGTEAISPEYRDLVLHNVLAGYGEPYEAVGLRKDGTTFPCEIQGKMFDYQGRPIRVTAIRNISTRRAAEQALRKSEERFRTLVENAPLAIAFSRNLKFVFANPWFVKLLGYTNAAELVGQPILDRIAPHCLSQVEELARSRENGLTADTKYEAVAVRKDGSCFPFEAYITRLSLSDGDVTAGFFHDITERQQAEEMRENLRNQLAQAHKMEAIGTLTGGIAHDFNNLLTIINGYTELILSEKPEDDPSYSDLQKILETGSKGAEMVQRLLAFSKKAEIGLQPLDLNSIVADSIKLMERTFPKMIEIETILAKDPAMVNADAVQVEQVLINLCINAKEAMPDGGKLRVETKIVTFDEANCKLHVGAKPGPHMLIEVADTGAGMDAETLGRIFDPFFTTKGWDFKKGTGLGLSVAKGIIEQHGGWISCESEQGKGTTLTLYFPIIEESMARKKPEPLTETVPRGEKILLVDDEDLVRDLGKRFLNKAGYTVITASNGREALEIFSREQSSIGLVVLDLIMPEMGGEKCLEELLRLNPQVKVVVSSGHSLSPQERELLGVSAKGFVNKPYQLKEFLKVVREVMDAE